MSYEPSIGWIKGLYLNLVQCYTNLKVQLLKHEFQRKPDVNLNEKIDLLDSGFVSEFEPA